MKLETTTLPANESHELTNMPGVLTRVETTPASGWMLFGRSVEQWADDAVKESTALEYLARKIATAEGLTRETNAQEFVDRVMALEEEARAFARK